MGTIEACFAAGLIGIIVPLLLDFLTERQRRIEAAKEISRPPADWTPVEYARSMISGRKYDLSKLDLDVQLEIMQEIDNIVFGLKTEETPTSCSTTKKPQKQSHDGYLSS